MPVFFLFAAFLFIWLYCEHLQHVFCQIDEVVFLICMCFFSICSVFLCVVSICSTFLCVVSICSMFLCVVSICSVFLCVVSICSMFLFLQHVYLFGCVMSICSGCVFKLIKTFFFNLLFFSIYSMLSSLGRHTYRLNT